MKYHMCAVMQIVAFNSWLPSFPVTAINFKIGAHASLLVKK